MAKRKNSKKARGSGERSSLKQKQKQTQIVNVNIRGEPKQKSTRRRKRRQPKPTMEDLARADYLQPQQLPIVAYQTGYGTYPIIQGQPAQNVPPPQPFYMRPPAPRSISLVPELVPEWQIESEGTSQILEQPTKQEQLNEFITPVESPREEIPLSSNFTQQFNPMADVGSFDFGVGPVYEEYGSQYNEPFNAMEQLSSITESTIPNVKKGTKAFYIQKIKEMTGQEYSKNRMKLNEFKTLYERIKGKKEFN